MLLGSALPKAVPRKVDEIEPRSQFDQPFGDKLLHAKLISSLNTKFYPHIMLDLINYFLLLVCPTFTMCAL